MTRGMGEKQFTAQLETEEKILKCIQNFPGIHSRGIIRKTKCSPNAVTNAIKRLFDKGKIFRNIKTSRKNFGYVYNDTCYKNQDEFIKYMQRQQEIYIDDLKKLHDEQFQFYKPKIHELSLAQNKLIQGNHESTLFQFRNSLGVTKVNSTMIGFFIYLLIERMELNRSDVPWNPEFYFKMMDKEYTQIKFEIADDFRNFCQKFYKYDPLKFIHSESIETFQHLQIL